MRLAILKIAVFRKPALQQQLPRLRKHPCEMFRPVGIGTCGEDAAPQLSVTAQDMSMGIFLSGGGTESAGI